MRLIYLLANLILFVHKHYLYKYLLFQQWRLSSCG